MIILTAGHSTRTFDELLGVLVAHRVQLVVDVRRFPASRRHPQFNREVLEEGLGRAGVEYLWLPAIGGRRSRLPNSPHTAWREPAFAGYADHMDTEEFRGGVRVLIERAKGKVTCLLCAEALPQKCHRRLIADWLVAHGVVVKHVLDEKRVEEHALTPFARVSDGRVVYDVGQLSLLKP